ncbi:PepSY domain-containing protein [Helicobacter sp. 11S02629-2]|uniref:PepSY domain-containing protein n=1 Tax=Helicobacter sp. 11S02629-2 TaxID=1476195 RepID=UPI000BA5286E|nr:PepSY domain-containing protein [Helicobacter sp. 11S02629-2]PAF45587.1 hypothetical protein BKH40_01525 [Helicobacter sp. 11S02629-2]
MGAVVAIKKRGFKNIKAKFFRAMHMYLSVFFLPWVLAYIATGIMYISGFNQDAGATKQSFILERHIDKKDDLLPALKEHAKTKGLRVPDSKPSPIKGESLSLSLATPGYALNIISKNNQTTISTIERNFLGVMLMMHKSKAGMLVNIFAIAFGISMVLMYLSGFIYTAWCKHYRKSSIITLVAGFVIFFFLFWLSL